MGSVSGYLLLTPIQGRSIGISLAKHWGHTSITRETFTKIIFHYILNNKSSYLDFFGPNLSESQIFGLWLVENYSLSNERSKMPFNNKNY